ncbi:ferritin-like domain-containing protein [Bacillus aquiflavi]|uniref:Ferritin-like domain-containing protein n=1 Tax=Bacillus aquiflavi TaxID=2672567 RepID=A0A6B3VVP8_9BACI|nr:ferritin-like domain-containing protein [Bacillus aquiflavi]MBA4537863.1 ferritin-like domain-containing protein [Bacillus aquiflavi]NEY82119.1 ferritin-like domain-containing protein [Bacillus aquiflavi]UAC48436.1 ferritin-like domain-containing protein [Bacillus aquiflavi]
MYVPYYDVESSSRQDSLVYDIARAINGEYSTIICYGVLAEKAPNSKTRKRILEIRSDEVRHFETFSKIYTALTGRQPKPRQIEPCPEKYRKGLEAAFIDEQETVDFYLDIIDKTNDPYIRRQFRRAASDEQNHAVWFLRFLMKQGR